MTYQHVNYLWDDAAAAKLDPVGRLVYRSNLLGSDQRITNTGGGNTSSKLPETDPLTGEKTTVLWVKGSGGDLRTSQRENFSSLYQDKLQSLQPLYAKRADKGLKAPAEDDMVGMYAHTTFNLNPRASSIDTPLHAFINGKHVDHMHPNAVIAIAASRRCEELTREIFGGEMACAPWMRPGFELGLAMQEINRAQPGVKAIMMGQHGFISWDDDDKRCYEETLRFIERASQYIDEKYQAKGGDATAFGGAKYQTLDQAARRAALAQILPWLRGQVSAQKRFVGTVQDDERILRFINSHDAPRLAELGTSCPDHFLRTKIKPLYVDWNPQAEDAAALKGKLKAGLEQYRQDYAAYYDRCKHANSPAMRDPNPTVVLIPGLGMVAWGKDKSESRVTAEFYNCAVEVMRGAEAIDEYIALPPQEAFDIEYWLLEEAKLARMPAEKELARQVHVVVGAGSGIGKEVAHRLAREGAHIVAVDLNAAAAEATAGEITEQYGQGIGVAGSDLSGCGPAVGLSANVTDRRQHPRDARPGGHRLRRVRFHRGDGGGLRAQRHHGPHPRRPVGADLRHQRHGQLPRRGRGVQDLAGTGAQGRTRADDQRQRRRGQEGQRGLRHEQGRREPPGARTGDGTRAPGAGQRGRPGDRRAGQRDVPARPRDRQPRQVRHPVRGRRGDRLARGQARAVLRRPHADEIAPSRPPTRPRRISCASASA